MITESIEVIKTYRYVTIKVIPQLVDAIRKEIEDAGYNFLYSTVGVVNDETEVKVFGLKGQNK